MKIATIARDKTHSPNMAANDTAILEAVTAELLARGAEVVSAEERIFDGIDAVCHMSRTHTVLQELERAEKNGVKIINTPRSIDNCARDRIMTALKSAGILQPEFTLIEADTDLDRLQYPAWIKRADGCSCHKDDVCFADNAAEVREAVERMHNRGVGKQIHCVHINGDIIKFYGVGRSFFRYCYPDPEKSKFGLERINGTPEGHAFSLENMREAVFAAAETIGLEIYGGDCIVDSNGHIYIIDLNDFPSFSAVRKEAAEEIAEYIINKIKEKA